MYRSVTESRQTPTHWRVIYWAEGVLVGVGVCALLLLGLGWLNGS